MNAAAGSIPVNRSGRSYAFPLLPQPIPMHHAFASLRKPIALLCIAASLWTFGAGTADAQGTGATVPSRNVHYPLGADMPPGALGAARLSGRGPVHGHYQRVAVHAPEGTRLALAAGSVFAPPVETPLQAGLLVGAVYRFQVTSIPNQPGVELFPTVEIIDRLYPPPGVDQFAIPVHLDMDDLYQALEGRLVTRVIYLEDPQTALPVADERNSQRSFDVRADHDPLQEADRLGRPVAVLRIGSRVPPREPALMQGFMLGSPPWLPVATEAPVASETH